MEWNDRFMTLFRDAVERYHLRPQTAIERFFLPDELEFLASIGSGAAEMHSYVQEYATQGEPSPATALLIAAARRAFFMTQQRGMSGNAQPVRARDLPAENEEFQEIAYLPRIISKASAKLYGTLDPAVMYYCAKDRQFLREHGNIPPADFLYLTWTARGDKQKIVMHVLNAMRDKPHHPEEAPAAPNPTPTAPTPAAPAPAVPPRPASPATQQELPLN